MFKEVLASKLSISKRVLIHGVGVNDTDYKPSIKINGRKVSCPYYARWCHMLERCYSQASLKARPTYKNCTVCDEWLIFSNFRAWMIKQDWQGKELDKDILAKENKIYSPDTCIFVTAHVNQLINDSMAIRGQYERGVCLRKNTGKFKVSISINNKSVHLGYFFTENEASKAYKKAKYSVIYKEAIKQSEPLRTALLNYKITG